MIENETRVIDEFVASIVVLDDGGERFDPVARIEIVGIAEHFVRWGVDVATHDAHAIALFRELSDVFFEVGDVIHGFFDASFDRLAERPVFLPAPSPIGVVDAVEVEERTITPVSEMGEEDEIFGDGIKDITVEDEVAARWTFVNVVFDDRKIFECEREKGAENIVMVAAQVDHLGPTLLKFLEDDANEARVGLGPLSGAFELPAVDNISIEDELLAADVAEEAAVPRWTSEMMTVRT